MSTTVRRGRTLRSRLLAYITNGVDRLRSAWRILTTAQTRLLNALVTIAPSRNGISRRLRAAISDFNGSLADFYRAAVAYAESWAATDLPLIYREGALTMLDNADRPDTAFTWTDQHRAAITGLSAQYYTDVMARIQETLRRARVFLRAVQDVARNVRSRVSIPQLRREHPLDTVVYANQARHPVDAWALTAVTWQAVTTANTAACRTALDDLGVQFVEVRDGAQCGWESHDSEDKADRTLRTVQDALAHPTSHPHCVVEGTQVQAVGAIQIGYRFKKSGRLVCISTAGGNELTITPNHPILTGRGWIASGDVKEGDDVFVSAGKIADPTLPHLDQVPAPVEQVFAALGQASASSSTVAAADDFHGDGPDLDSQVDVVGTDGELWRVVDASGGQQRAQLDLQVADPRTPALPVDGALLQQLDRLDLTSPGGMRSLYMRRVGVPAPRSESPFLEAIPDGGFTDVEFLRQAEDRLAIKMTTDNVVKVRYFDSAVRHVYDLSTSEHAYFANGILVHNCVREFLPRLDLAGRTNITSGASL
jgi:hypothetical protein